MLWVRKSAHVLPRARPSARRCSRLRGPIPSPEPYLNPDPVCLAEEIIRHAEHFIAGSLQTRGVSVSPRQLQRGLMGGAAVVVGATEHGTHSVENSTGLWLMSMND